MPQQDGAIVIDTGMDTSGFEKGSDKLLKAVQDTASSVEKIGDKAAKSLSNIRIEPDMNSGEFDRTAARMDLKVQGVLKSLDRLSDASLQGLQSSKAVASFNRGIDEARMKIDEARIDLEEFGSYEFPTEQYNAAVSGLEKVEKELTKYREQQARMIALDQDKPSKEWTKICKKIKETKEEAQNYVKAAAVLLRHGIDSGADWDKNAFLWKDTQKDIREYEAELDRLQAKGGDHSKKWNLLAEQIKAAESQVAEYETLIRQMEESGQAMIDPLQTDQYKQMEADLQAAEEALEHNQMIISQEAIEQARLNVLAAQEAYNRAETTSEQVKALDNLKAAQTAYAGTLESQMQPDELENGWTRFRDIVKGVHGTLSEFKTKAKDVGSTIAKIGSTAYKAFSKVGNGIKGAISKVKGFISSASKSSLSVNNLAKKFTSLGSMLKSRIKRTFVGAVFKDLQASIQALAQYNSAFNRAMSNMKNRSSELSANVAVAFGGLVRQFEPIITRLLNTLSDAMVKINAVMAAIRGESTVEVAARQTQDYAASLSDQTKQSEKARAAQEKLNRTLTSYDEIHKLADSSSNSSSDSAVDNAAKFQTVSVNSILNSTDGFGALADRIRQAIAGGDWRALGVEVGNGLNNIINTIDKKLIEAKVKAAGLAHSIAEGLNGLTDAFDSYSFGKTVAHAINLGLDFAYEFLTDYDFSRLGQKTADGLNGLLDNFDGRKLGGTIAAGINGAIDWAFETVTNLDWDKLGSKIGDIFNALFGGGNKITERATKDVGGAARDAYLNSMESSVRGIDWKKLAQTFSAALSGALNSIASFMETADWEAVGQSIVDFCEGIDWDSIAQGIYRLLGAAIGGVSGLLKGAFKATQEKSKDWGAELFDEYGEQFNKAGDSIAAGIWGGIKAFFTDLVKKVKDDILKPFVSGFEKAFGIASPAKEMKPEGKYVAEGILAGITSVFDDIASWIEDNILRPFTDGFKDKFRVVGNSAKALFSSGESIASGIKSGLSSKWNDVSTFIGTKADEIKATIMGKDYSSAGSSIVSSIDAGITSAWGEFESTNKQRLGKIFDGADASSFSTAGSAAAEGLAQGIESNWPRTVGDTIWHKINDLKGWFADDGRERFKEAGHYLVDGLNQGIQDRFSISRQVCAELGGAALEAFRKAVGESSPSRIMKTYGRYYVEGFNIGIEDSADDAVSTVRNLAKGVEAEAAKIEPSAQLDFETTGLDRVADKLSQIAQSLMTITKLMPQISAIGTPAIAVGAFAPAGTAVTPSGSDRETKQMLSQILGILRERENSPATPIQLESTVVLDGREIGRTTAEYNTSSSRIDNGNWNGGLTR